MLAENLDTQSIRAKLNTAVFVLPVAAIEQHGPHLGIVTDTALVTAVAQGAESRRPNDVLLYPTLPIGCSPHHLGFAGTLSISPETYAQVLVEIVQGMIGWGARRILILNGHGGNVSPAKHALTILSAQGHSAWVTFAPYWDMADKAFFGAPPMETDTVSHACEYETSMMMIVRPQAVYMDRIQPHKRYPPNDYIKPEGLGGGISYTLPFHHMTDTGNMGSPELSTPAKGKHLLESATAGVVKFVDSFKTWTFPGDLRMPKQEIKHPDKQVTTGAYSSGVLCDGWLYVSGQGPIDMKTGQVVHGSIEEETQLTLSHIDKILKAGGCTRDDVVKCTVHLADIGEFGRYNKVYAEYFTGIRPARTTVQSVLWGGIKVEIDCVAKVPARKVAKKKATPKKKTRR